MRSLISCFASWDLTLCRMHPTRRAWATERFATAGSFGTNTISVTVQQTVFDGRLAVEIADVAVKAQLMHSEPPERALVADAVTSSDGRVVLWHLARKVNFAVIVRARVYLADVRRHGV
eukprot:TRINITY_DN37495_c0_g1_i1.p2 TRINITY_DN37495_c0_g1~~TRINITY_DN37495_c0_g1_i1.p2  ORF type:complete len:119 (-),score=14.58 TRINITY_DN37495_c0_g1_i1:193-549(-)